VTIPSQICERICAAAALQSGVLAESAPFDFTILL
jgi:hypothetical protein